MAFVASEIKMGTRVSDMSSATPLINVGGSASGYTPTDPSKVIKGEQTQVADWYKTKNIIETQISALDPNDPNYFNDLFGLRNQMDELNSFISLIEAEHTLSNTAKDNTDENAVYMDNNANVSYDENGNPYTNGFMLKSNALRPLFDRDGNYNHLVIPKKQYETLNQWRSDAVKYFDESGEYSTNNSNYSYGGATDNYKSVKITKDTGVVSDLGKRIVLFQNYDYSTNHSFAAWFAQYNNFSNAVQNRFNGAPIVEVDGQNLIKVWHNDSNTIVIKEVTAPDGNKSYQKYYKKGKDWKRNDKGFLGSIEEEVKSNGMTVIKEQVNSNTVLLNLINRNVIDFEHLVSYVFGSGMGEDISESDEYVIDRINGMFSSDAEADNVNNNSQVELANTALAMLGFNVTTDTPFSVKEQTIKGSDMSVEDYNNVRSLFLRKYKGETLTEEEEKDLNSAIKNMQSSYASYLKGNMEQAITDLRNFEGRRTLISDAIATSSSSTTEKWDASRTEYTQAELDAKKSNDKIMEKWALLAKYRAQSIPVFGPHGDDMSVKTNIYIATMEGDAYNYLNTVNPSLYDKFKNYFARLNNEEDNSTKLVKINGKTFYITDSPSGDIPTVGDVADNLSQVFGLVTFGINNVLIDFEGGRSDLINCQVIEMVGAGVAPAYKNKYYSYRDKNGDWVKSEIKANVKYEGQNAESQNYTYAVIPMETFKKATMTINESEIGGFIENSGDMEIETPYGTATVKKLVEARNGHPIAGILSTVPSEIAQEYLYRKKMNPPLKEKTYEEYFKRRIDEMIIKGLGGMKSNKDGSIRISLSYFSENNLKKLFKNQENVKGIGGYKTYYDKKHNAMVMILMSSTSDEGNLPSSESKQWYDVFMGKAGEDIKETKTSSNVITLE